MINDHLIRSLKTCCFRLLYRTNAKLRIQYLDWCLLQAYMLDHLLLQLVWHQIGRRARGQELIICGQDQPLARTKLLSWKDFTVSILTWVLKNEETWQIGLAWQIDKLQYGFKTSVVEIKANKSLYFNEWNSFHLLWCHHHHHQKVRDH